MFSDRIKHTLNFLGMFLQLPELIWWLRNVPISKKVLKTYESMNGSTWSLWMAWYIVQSGVQEQFLPRSKIFFGRFLLSARDIPQILLLLGIFVCKTLLIKIHVFMLTLEKHHSSCCKTPENTLFIENTYMFDFTKLYITSLITTVS